MKNNWQIHQLVLGTSIVVPCYLIVLCKTQQQPLEVSTESMTELLASQVSVNFVLGFHRRWQTEARDRVYLL